MANLKEGCVEGAHTWVESKSDAKQAFYEVALLSREITSQQSKMGS